MTSTTGLHWCSGFDQLGNRFLTHLHPTPVNNPYWVARNDSLAKHIGIDSTWFSSTASLEFWSGNKLLPEAPPPYASVYSGHQFGVWAGQLGDGRAITLGEVTPKAQDSSTSQLPLGLEIQLKGSGRTPYSRGGDGRAVLRSSIREYLCSIAMHSLGIPTTQALCIIGSPDHVQREKLETAAIVTRVAPSFLRFGHFEHFASRQMLPELTALVQYTAKRYYPEALEEATLNLQAAALLRSISIRTGILLAHWQAIGFCHGVMNTDNMSALGLTIDYGPFQFLDNFNPQHICNHSDTQGRYAFNKQPQIAYWNLFCLGQALMPLIEDEAQAQQALALYPTSFQQHFHQFMLAKLGLYDAAQPTVPAYTQGSDDNLNHQQIIQDLLGLLASNKVDYTNFWRGLSHAVGTNGIDRLNNLFTSTPHEWNKWVDQYRSLYQRQNTAAMSQRMLATNPKFILRNHLAETAIRAAQQGDYDPVDTLQRLLSTPYDEHPDHEAHAASAPEWASSLTISCSS